MARPTGLAVLLVCATVPLAWSLSACGDEDSSKDAEGKSSKTADAPTLAEDKAAVEQVMLAYGAAKGAKSCDYLADNLIANYADGLAGCRDEFADAEATVYKVQSVAVNGDSANAVIVSSGKPRYYELIRVGDSNGVASGWKISSYPADGTPSVTSASAAAETETTTTETTASEDEPIDLSAQAEEDVTDLLNDFGQAQGAEVCGFFAGSLLKERGGLGACEKYFSDKPALDSTITSLKVSVPDKEDVVPYAIAVIKSGVNGNPLYIGLNQTPDGLDEYGGWAITSQNDDR